MQYRLKSKPASAKAYLFDENGTFKLKAGDIVFPLMFRDQAGSLVVWKSDPIQRENKQTIFHAPGLKMPFMNFNALFRPQGSRIYICGSIIDSLLLQTYIGDLEGEAVMAMIDENVSMETLQLLKNYFVEGKHAFTLAMDRTEDYEKLAVKTLSMSLASNKISFNRFSNPFLLDSLRIFLIEKNREAEDKKRISKKS